MARLDFNIIFRRRPLAPVPAAAPVAAPTDPARPRAKLYAMQGCPHCVDARTWLVQHRIPHEVIDADDPRAEGFESFPLIETADGRRVEGYDADELARLFEVTP